MGWCLFIKKRSPIVLGANGVSVMCDVLGRKTFNSKMIVQETCSDGRWRPISEDGMMQASFSLSRYTIINSAAQSQPKVE